MGTPAPSSRATLPAGSPFGPGGAYVVQRLLGTGGMGSVYLALQTSLGRDVAIKVLDPAETDPEVRERFLAEPRLMVKFPDAAASHIVPVLDCGTDPATGLPYYVMEAELLTPDAIRAVCESLAARAWTDADAPAAPEPPRTSRTPRVFSTAPQPPRVGARTDADAPRPLSLADFLRDGHVLPDEPVARLALDILPALATLHGSGIVHRDLKPSNLLFSATGRLLLADFGIAKDLADFADGPTQRRLASGGQPGTHHYAAPEQLGGRVAVPATDYYALGVVLFRALTGGFPVAGAAPGSLPADCPTRFRRAWQRLLGALLAPDSARRLHDPETIEPALRRILRAAERRRRLSAWWARHRGRIVAAAGIVALAANIVQIILFLESIDHEHHPAGTLRTVALPGGLPLELAWIPAGRFEVQGVGRTHTIGVTRGFWMATAETTRAQWAAVMGTDFPTSEEADMPVSRVSWADATNFIAHANALVPGLALSLPTEAEWELAAIGGGADAAQAVTNAWHAGNSGRHPHPGRQLAPNAYCLFDMGGNVAEWCRDWNGPERFVGAGLHRNPAGPETGSERVCRGGSFLSAPANVGPAARTSAFPDARMPHIGFRVAARAE